jgi:hypothetical protein
MSVQNRASTALPSFLPSSLPFSLLSGRTTAASLAGVTVVVVVVTMVMVVVVVGKEGRTEVGQCARLFEEEMEK